MIFNSAFRSPRIPPPPPIWIETTKEVDMNSLKTADLITELVKRNIAMLWSVADGESVVLEIHQNKNVIRSFRTEFTSGPAKIMVILD